MPRQRLKFHFLTTFFYSKQKGLSDMCPGEGKASSILQSKVLFPYQNHSKSNHFVVEGRKPLIWARGSASTGFHFPKTYVVIVLEETYSSSAQCGKSARFYSIHPTNVYWWLTCDSLLTSRNKKEAIRHSLPRWDQSSSRMGEQQGKARRWNSNPLVWPLHGESGQRLSGQVEESLRADESFPLRIKYQKSKPGILRAHILGIEIQ